MCTGIVYFSREVFGGHGWLLATMLSEEGKAEYATSLSRVVGGTIAENMANINSCCHTMQRPIEATSKIGSGDWFCLCIHQDVEFGKKFKDLIVNTDKMCKLIKSVSSELICNGECGYDAQTMVSYAMAPRKVTQV